MRRRSGFTLLELVVVIIVLGLLAGIVAPQIIGRLSEAKSTTARTQIELLSVALDGYRLDNGSYPTTDQGLAALRERRLAHRCPRTGAVHICGRQYRSIRGGANTTTARPASGTPAAFDLESLGRDGKIGGEGEDADVR